MNMSPEQVTKITMVRPQAGKEQSVLNTMQAYAEKVKAEDPNVLSWHIIDIQEPGEDGGKEYAVLERYANEEADKAHFTTPYFADLKALMPDLRQPIASKRTAPCGGFMFRK